MKAMTRIISILTGFDPLSDIYINALSGDNIGTTVDIASIMLQNGEHSVYIFPKDGGVLVESNYIEGNQVYIPDPISALNIALAYINIKLSEDDTNSVGIMRNGYPVYPPAYNLVVGSNTPMYSQNQLQEYAQKAVKLFADNPPEFDLPDFSELCDIGFPDEEAEMDEDDEDDEPEFCQECGGMIGDDCDCNREWEYEDCDECGCDKDSCTCENEDDN